MAIRYAHGKSTASAKAKVMVSALAGLIVGVLAVKYISWHLAPVLGWDTAALVYVVWEWSLLWRMNGTVTASHALREDPSRRISSGIVLLASVASLVAVGLVLATAQNAQGGGKVLRVLLGVFSVVVAWIVVHTIFTLRYAELYYGDRPGGVEFDGTSQPSYQDFAYLAFTIGMTFQVSDTGFQSTDLRKMALKHALISYLFGTVIVATTINLIAGLTK